MCSSMSSQKWQILKDRHFPSHKIYRQGTARRSAGLALRQVVVLLEVFRGRVGRHTLSRTRGAQARVFTRVDLLRPAQSPRKTVARCLRGNRDDAIDAFKDAESAPYKVVVEVRRRLPNFCMTSPCKFAAPFITESFNASTSSAKLGSNARSKRIIYNIQRRSLRHADRERDKPPLQPRIDEEGARARFMQTATCVLLMDLTCVRNCHDTARSSRDTLGSLTAASTPSRRPRRAWSISVERGPNGLNSKKAAVPLLETIHEDRDAASAPDFELI